MERVLVGRQARVDQRVDVEALGLGEGGGLVEPAVEVVQHLGVLRQDVEGVEAHAADATTADAGVRRPSATRRGAGRRARRAAGAPATTAQPPCVPGALGCGAASPGSSALPLPLSVPVPLPLPPVPAVPPSSPPPPAAVPPSSPPSADAAAAAAHVTRGRVARHEIDERLDLIVRRPALPAVAEPGDALLHHAEVLLVGARLAGGARRPVEREREGAVGARRDRALDLGGAVATPPSRCRRRCWRDRAARSCRASSSCSTTWRPCS